MEARSRRVRSRRVIGAIVAAIAFGLSFAASAAHAVPYSTARLTFSDSTSRTYTGTCYSSNGRYAATVRHYLKRPSSRHGWRWELVLVSGTLSDFQTGTGAKYGLAHYYTWRYRGNGYGPGALGFNPQFYGYPNVYGTFSYSPPFMSQSTPAGWWWSYFDEDLLGQPEVEPPGKKPRSTVDDWYFNAASEDIDFNGDSSKDCQIIFAYHYPWTNTNDKLPVVPWKPPPWYPESPTYPNP
jgi:hypothetical protein